MNQRKLTPGQRSALKLKIIRKANEDPVFEKRLQQRLDEIALERESNSTEEIIKAPNNTNNKNAVFPILRWLGIIPGAILGFALANLMMWVISNFVLIAVGDYEIVNIVVKVLGGVYAGIAFVVAGLFVAPKFKKEVTIALTVLLAIIMSLSIFSGLYITNDYISSLLAISSIGGGVYACFKYLKSSKIL